MADRTCVLCRKVEEKEKILRFVLLENGDLALDLLAKLPGRGCYLHRECLFQKGGLRTVRNMLKKGEKIKSKDTSQDSKMIQDLLSATRTRLTDLSCVRDREFAEAKLSDLEALSEVRRDKLKEAKIRL